MAEDPTGTGFCGPKRLTRAADANIGQASPAPEPVTF